MEQSSPTLLNVEDPCRGCGVCCMHMVSPPFVFGASTELQDDEASIPAEVLEDYRLRSEPLRHLDYG